jgi:hypothetical protein
VRNHALAVLEPVNASFLHSGALAELESKSCKIPAEKLEKR